MTDKGVCPAYPPKAWYFKIGRLNMISGEPVGLILRVPGFELIVSIYAA